MKTRHASARKDNKSGIDDGDPETLLRKEDERDEDRRPDEQPEPGQTGQTAPRSYESNHSESQRPEVRNDRGHLISGRVQRVRGPCRHDEVVDLARLEREP